MSDDLIRRSDAIEAIHREARLAGGSVAIEYADMFQYAIKDIPSADRPQGEWIKDKSKNIWDMVVDCYKCSNCGKKAIDHSLILDTTGLSYCPNCGARMKGKDDEA